VAEYDNTNTGILARNERKEKDTHPDLQGSINVDGKEYWLSAWSKRGKSGKLEGKPFFILSVKPKEDRQESASQWVRLDSGANTCAQSSQRLL